jgi:hypothetical protein
MWWKKEKEFKKLINSFGNSGNLLKAHKVLSNELNRKPTINEMLEFGEFVNQ